jgi:hypothetical protein
VKSVATSFRGAKLAEGILQTETASALSGKEELPKKGKNMSRTFKVLLIVNAVFVIWSVFATTGRAQRPAPLTPDGVPFLMVNINPTDTPPMVNVNPYGNIPKVEVTQMPEIQIAPNGCEDRRNFQTSVGRSIAGPLVVTFLNAPADTVVSLTGGEERSRSFKLTSSMSVATAIYLETGQRLDFDSDVMYSGCRPN